MLERKTYLIQRIRRSYRQEKIDFKVFGNGLKNEKLTEKKAKEFSKAYTYDYMGSAEFDFGAIPKSLREMSQRKLELGSIEVSLHGFTEWEIPIDSKKNFKEYQALKTKIYYLCPTEDKEYAEKLIKSLAKDDILGELKEPPRFRQGCWTEQYGAPDDKASNTIGWLALDNGIVMSTDLGLVDLFKVLIKGN